VRGSLGKDCNDALTARPCGIQVFSECGEEGGIGCILAALNFAENRIHKADVAIDHDLYSCLNLVRALTSYHDIQDSDREAGDHDH
jgi:hypothetical protein